MGHFSRQLMLPRNTREIRTACKRKNICLVFLDHLSCCLQESNQGFRLAAQQFWALGELRPLSSQPLLLWLESECDIVPSYSSFPCSVLTVLQWAMREGLGSTVGESRS